jgi:hypothetical protein
MDRGNLACRMVEEAQEEEQEVDWEEQEVEAAEEV